MAKENRGCEVEMAMARVRPVILAERDRAAAQSQQVIRAMSGEAERCRETLAHHLLDLPLHQVFYYWVILRLKYRPWRVLIPLSALGVLVFRLILGTVPNLWHIMAGGLAP